MTGAVARRRGIKEERDRKEVSQGIWEEARELELMKGEERDTASERALTQKTLDRRRNLNTASLK